MATYEIEIKSLLGSSGNADRLRKKLHEVEPATKFLSRHKQLNHYFINGDVHKLYTLLKSHIHKEEAEKLKTIVGEGSDFSIRTRLADETLLFVIKASRDEGTSHNTIARLEFEAKISDMTLEELDQLMIDAGFVYQAKWSREREEYSCGDITVCLDKNAGYGYLAEFEKMSEDETLMASLQKEIRLFMDKLGVEELPQDRLERMFAHYNANWQNYYGTDNIFDIK